MSRIWLEIGLSYHVLLTHQTTDWEVGYNSFIISYLPIMCTKYEVGFMYLLLAVKKSHNKLTLILVVALSLHDIVFICDKTAENIKKHSKVSCFTSMKFLKQS